MSEQRPIVRVWTGVVRTQAREASADYVDRTGIDAYRSTPGSLGAWLLTRDLGEGHTEITTVSRWDSMAAVIAFAGDDPERAVYYPEDDRYLAGLRRAGSSTSLNRQADRGTTHSPQRTPHAYVCCCSFKYMSVSVSRTPSIWRMRPETSSSRWASLSHTTSASTS